MTSSFRVKTGWLSKLKDIKLLDMEFQPQKREKSFLTLRIHLEGTEKQSQGEAVKKTVTAS